MCQLARVLPAPPPHQTPTRAWPLHQLWRGLPGAGVACTPAPAASLASCAPVSPRSFGRPPAVRRCALARGLSGGVLGKRSQSLAGRGPTPPRSIARLAGSFPRARLREPPQKLAPWRAQCHGPGAEGELAARPSAPAPGASPPPPLRHRRQCVACVRPGVQGQGPPRCGVGRRPLPRRSQGGASQVRRHCRPLVDQPDRGHLPPLPQPQGEWLRRALRGSVALGAFARAPAARPSRCVTHSAGQLAAGGLRGGARRPTRAPQARASLYQRGSLPP